MKIRADFSAALLLSLLLLPGNVPGRSGDVAQLPLPPLQPAVSQGAAPSSASTATSSAGLPLPVRYQYSAAVGQDNPEFHFRPAADGYAAESGALYTTVTGDSARLSLGSESFAIVPTALGRTMPQELPPASPARVQENRLDRDRGPLTEWFVNGPLGLQQAWTVNDRPTGAGPMVLDLAVSGGSASLANARDARLTSPAGTVLPYGGLLAYDAAGQDLPAEFVATATGLSIAVHDAGAVYPVTIDPFATIGMLTAGQYTEESAAFGLSVAVSGNGTTIAVGSLGSVTYGPAVYVFERPALGWGGAMPSPARLKGVTFGPTPTSLGMSKDGSVIVAPGPNASQILML